MAAIAVPDTFTIDLTGKTAIITGGASGIGLATAKILSLLNATVHILDICPLQKEDASANPELIFHQCDVTSWPEQREAFAKAGHIDMVFANAGVSERANFFTDTFDDDGNLKEPSSTLMDVNLTGVLYTVKLAWYTMKQQESQGSIVITTSATAYVPWQSLAVYTSAKLALVGLIRSLRSLLVYDNITINGIAPGATVTKLLPDHLHKAVKAIGAPISTAHTVAKALVYSATTVQPRRVEDYGKDKSEERNRTGRWNGRVIVVLGDTYTEVEEPYAELRSTWLGHENSSLFKAQQAATDGRRLE